MTPCTGFSLDRLVLHGADSQKRGLAAEGLAVLRCERGGDALRVEKPVQWQSIEVTYHPERTILR